MLFSMMIMLAISSSIVELVFAAKIPAWRQLAYKYKWFNMSISIALSFVLGLMFSAGGLIALGAAMISTALSIPGYAFLYWNYDSPQAQDNGGNMLSTIWTKWKQVFKDLMKVIYTIIRIITFPIWFTRLAFRKYAELRSRFTRTPTTV